MPPAGELSTPYRVEIVASRLQAPWSVVFAPDGRIFFSERPGWVRVIENGRILETPALVLKDVTPSVKMGLLGLAVDPGFATNRHVYAAYNYEEGAERYRLRVVRYRERHNELMEPRVLLEGIPAYRNHTGCRLKFGPDGLLYVTTGDANDPPLAQRLDSYAGKILRLKPDGSVPSDNPFVGKSNALGAIWSYGHRNPQGLAFQHGTGRLFAPEHGPDHGDEVNLIEKGGNYGWPTIHHRQKAERMHSPWLEFSPAIGPAAALFYTGEGFPELKGNLLVACLRGEGILNIELEAGAAKSCERLLHRQFGRIREVTEGPDGAVYFTTSQFDPPEGTPRAEYDMILRLVPASGSSSGLAIAAPWQGGAEQAFDAGTTNATELVTIYCAACHGPGLRGGMQRGLLSGNWQFAKDDERMRKVIHGGLAEKGMPGFGAALTSEQIEVLKEYIRVNQVQDPGPAGTVRPKVKENEFQ